MSRRYLRGDRVASSVSAWRSDNVIASAIASGAVVAPNLSPWEPDSAKARPRWCAFAGALRIRGVQNEPPFRPRIAKRKQPSRFRKFLESPVAVV